MKVSLILFSFLILLSSCFRRYTMTEKQVRDHYAGKTMQPCFYSLHSDSITLFCAAAGADTLPPLLLIHGAPGGWFSYLNILDDTSIQNHYQVISVDRPGYHRSKLKGGRRKAFTSINRQAKAIHEALMINHSSKPGVLLGSSFGGPVAAKLAYLYPDEFRQAILLAPAIDPSKEKFWWFSSWGHSSFIRVFLPRFINAATDEKFTHIAELKKMLPDWERIQIPVTVVQGSADRIVDPANLEFARAHLKQRFGEFIFIPGAGHLIRRQHPEIVKALVLKSAEPASTLK